MSNRLVVRLPNWVGDVMMCLPTLEALEKQGFVLEIVGSSWIQHLFAGLHWSVHPLPRSRWQAFKALQKIPGRNMLLFPNSFSSALMALAAGKKTLGYSRDHRGWLLRYSLSRPRGAHQVESFWHLGNMAAGKWGHGRWPQEIPAAIKLPLVKDAFDRRSQILDSQKIKPPYWVLGTYATGTIDGTSKIWPHWHALASALLERGFTLVICPGPGEETVSQQQLPETVISLPGLNLQDFATVLSGAEQVITNDTGPMHLAAAVNDRVLGLFGVTDPAMTRPWNADYIGEFGRWPNVDEVLEALF